MIYDKYNVLTDEQKRKILEIEKEEELKRYKSMYPEAFKDEKSEDNDDLFYKCLQKTCPCCGYRFQ